MESVIQVLPKDNYKLELWFDTGEHRLFDMSPYLNKGVFIKLKDRALFDQAYVGLGTVCWPGELDVAPETLYDRSTALG
ncbi:hypothetical protein A1353_05460 [Methylomonas methanica]|uniref:DUF2442 domain-containing protein n=1 Tax=Methylomonas methanica TaxID=421 RepID=A0A177MUB0_METMH|nr:DUF2442 domain-containing protein [Methylomonas methanica]OAI09014.1 hypothetical protein A1353_05460 [Methylomonas methanica]